ncbi:hypothetical protein QCA50_010604 [Cerrena zonata]|uniref:Protein kinase domain-containing protein n=1 Tax=Cerrena zonata TaxID=2478898 RepID=A0AAW0GBC9_9APHY
MPPYISYSQLLYGEGMPAVISEDAMYLTGYVESSFATSRFTARLAAKSTIQNCIVDGELTHIFHIIFVDLSGIMQGVVTSLCSNEIRELHNKLHPAKTYNFFNARFCGVAKKHTQDHTIHHQIRLVLDSSVIVKEILESTSHGLSSGQSIQTATPIDPFSERVAICGAWWLFSAAWNAAVHDLTGGSYLHPDGLAATDLVVQTVEPIAHHVADLIQELLDRLHDTEWSRYRKVFRRVLVKLCRTSGCLPATFLLDDIDDIAKQSFGHGSYSDVYRATFRGYAVALKRLRLFLTDQPGEPSLKSFYQEAILWRQLRHPNILPFIGIDTVSFETGPCIVSPFLAKGDVHKAMKNMPTQAIPVDRWLLEIAKGLDYLHGEGIAHGDVRGANILVDDSLHIKMGDFGLSTFIDSSTLSSGTHAGGTVRWMSPELLKSEISRPNFTSDIYSFGCTCIELYTQQKPFPHIALEPQVMFQVQKGERPQRPRSSWKFMSDEVWGMVSLCLHERPTSRPGMLQIVQHLSKIARINTIALAGGTMRNDDNHNTSDFFFSSFCLPILSLSKEQ